MTNSTPWDKVILQAQGMKSEVDIFVEKMSHWEREVPKMARTVQEIWSREKNSIQAKIDHLNAEYKKLILFPDTSLDQSAVGRRVYSIKNELDAVRQAYYRATSYLRQADRDAHRKEQEAQDQKSKTDRSAGISFGGYTPGVASPKKKPGSARSGGISL